MAATVTSKTRVNPAIFDYCVSLVKAAKKLGHEHPGTPWEIYREWTHNEEDLKEMERRFGGKKALLPKRSRAKDQTGKVFNYRAIKDRLKTGQI